MWYMARRTPILLISCFVAASCGTPPVDNSRKGSSPEATIAARKARLLEAIADLQANPWAGWPVGAKLVTRFADSTDQYPSVRHYAQPDLTYEVTGDGTTLVRRQETFEGEQRFEVNNQAERPVPGASPDRKPKRPRVVIDGISIECNKTLLEDATRLGQVAATTSWWTARDRPEVLLKRMSSNGNYWQVVGLSTRKIGSREYLCVETRRRMATTFGFVVTLEHLNSGVPGHVVESIKEFHSEDSTADIPILTMITREYAVAVDVPQTGTK